MVGNREEDFPNQFLSSASEFPALYNSDPYHFKQDIAAAAYDRLVSKARDEVRQTSDEDASTFVVVVCAGWNAENAKKNNLRSMKEAFFSKQLSLCKTTRELQQWADLNCGLDGGVSYQSTLKDLPKVFHQTNKADHEKLKGINSMNA